MYRQFPFLYCSWYNR
uniref:Uncharacterized protein n=1 Tax=Arundo donax TaxID=35708 RepID=A0A0A8Z7V8_ARUDO